MTEILHHKNIHYLVVHCSDTDNDDPITAKDIHQMHLGFGWDGVGYHRIITRDGMVEHGRPDYWVGAHVFEHNKESLGVCLIGRNDFTPPQMDGLAMVLTDWRQHYPNAVICGHCDFDNTEKTCPNFDAAAWATARNIL